MFPRLINTNFLGGFSIISYHITLLRLSQYPGSLIIISSTQNVLPSVAVSGTAFPLLITLIPIFSPFGSTSALVFSHFPPPIAPPTHYAIRYRQLERRERFTLQLVLFKRKMLASASACGRTGNHLSSSECQEMEMVLGSDVRQLHWFTWQLRRRGRGQGPEKMHTGLKVEVGRFLIGSANPLHDL